MILMSKEFYFLISIPLSAACITYLQAKIPAGIYFFVKVLDIYTPFPRFKICCLNCSYRKSLKPSGGKELNIFKLLPKYIEDPSLGNKFVDILLPSLTKKPHDWG